MSESKINKKIEINRPAFHFSTPVGWCNDPNGFSFYKGKIHLFFQYNPFSTQWGPMHWGHVTTTNFLTWENQPVALSPDTAADTGGCFSGTAIEDNDRQIIAYTGVDKPYEQGNSPVQQQCIAIGDGLKYIKSPHNPVITAKDVPFEFLTGDFRDPKLWKKENTCFMACVLKQKNGCGALVLFRSEDLINWKFVNTIDSSKDGLSKMWECPDILFMDGKTVLLLSPQEMLQNNELGFHNGNNCVYITGTLKDDFSFTREVRPENNYTAAQIDYGIDFYAPQTTKLPDGRCILIAWMQAWESYITPENSTWSGMMTLPREISLKNNRLIQKPVKEFFTLRHSEIQGQILQDSKMELAEMERHFELEILCSDRKTNRTIDKNDSLKIYLSTKGEQICLTVDFTNNKVTFDRRETLHPGNIPLRQEKIRLLNKDGTPESIHLICDTNSLEVYFNEGEFWFTNAFFMPASTKSTVSIVSGCAFNLNYRLWCLSHK